AEGWTGLFTTWIPHRLAMEPYVVLDPRQRALYRDVMQESYETLMALGEEPSPSRGKIWGWDG
uniref:KRAB domain-containing protein n=1 Tax=Zosterops lateralis melanops TaxID=1220523 RepID=A0A8D2PXR9_ZOSLA